MWVVHSTNLPRLSKIIFTPLQMIYGQLESWLMKCFTERLHGIAELKPS